MTARGTGGSWDEVVVERHLRPATEDDLADGSACLVGRRDGGPELLLARLR